MFQQRAIELQNLHSLILASNMLPHFFIKVMRKEKMQNYMQLW